MEQEIRACDKQIDRWGDTFARWQVFDSYRAKGNLRIKDKAFYGTRQEFVSKVKREKESFYKLLRASDFASAIRQIELSISDATEPYDKIGIVVHGHWDNNLNKPDGNVAMKGDSGSLIFMPRESFKDILHKSPLLNQFKEKIVFVSCFQTWKEPQIRPGETEKTAIDRAFNDAIEHPNVINPKWKLDCINGEWVSNFLPFDFTVKYGK